MSVKTINNSNSKNNVKNNHIKTPYYTLGEIASSLNNYFLVVKEGKSKENNIIIKKLPQFIDWIEKSKSNKKQLLKLYNFLKRRFEIYLPLKKLRSYKAIIKNWQVNASETKEKAIEYYDKLIKLYYELDNKFKKLAKIFDEMNIDKIEYVSRAHLYFMQGFDGSIYGKDDFIDSWIINSFMKNSPYYELSFTLGRYYYRTLDREVRLIGNLGLSKHLITWSKKINSTNLLSLFKKINISYFHSLRKFENGPQSAEENITLENLKISLDNLSRYRKKIEELFDELEKPDNSAEKNNNLIQFCFICGFLAHSLPENIKNGNYDKFYIPKNNVVKLIYDLGSLMRYICEFEIDELKSRSFKNVISNFRGMNRENILNILLYISKMLIRNSVKEAQEIIKNKGHMSNFAQDNQKIKSVGYKYSTLYQRILLKFIRSYNNDIKIDKYISSITFMLGYSYKGIRNKQKDD